MKIQLFNKTATRLAEAHWVTFNPIPQDGFNWKLEKMRELVDVLNLTGNASTHLHAVDSVQYTNLDETFEVKTKDATVVNPGEPNPFPTPMTLPDVTLGMHFNLYNNIWGTNYIMWYPYLEEDQSLLFRFSIKID